MADIPAGTGLGSSGSFTTCLLKALHKFKRHIIHPRELAELACHIEIDVLKEPVGKQDQYIAAYGGVTAFEFRPDDTVDVAPGERQRGHAGPAGGQPGDGVDRLLPGGGPGAARSRTTRTRGKDRAMIDNLALHQGARLPQPGGDRGRQTSAGSARLMHEHWQHKKKRSA